MAKNKTPHYTGPIDSGMRFTDMVSGASAIVLYIVCGGMKMVSHIPEGIGDAAHSVALSFMQGDILTVSTSFFRENYAPFEERREVIPGTHWVHQISEVSEHLRDVVRPDLPFVVVGVDDEVTLIRVDMEGGRITRSMEDFRRDFVPYKDGIADALYESSAGLVDGMAGEMKRQLLLRQAERGYSWQTCRPDYLRKKFSEAVAENNHTAAANWLTFMWWHGVPLTTKAPDHVRSSITFGEEKVLRDKALRLEQIGEDYDRLRDRLRDLAKLTKMPGAADDTDTDAILNHLFSALQVSDTDRLNDLTSRVLELGGLLRVPMDREYDALFILDTIKKLMKTRTVTVNVGVDSAPILEACDRVATLMPGVSVNPESDDNFMGRLLRQIGEAHNIPYEDLSRDFSNVMAAHLNEHKGKKAGTPRFRKPVSKKYRAGQAMYGGATEAYRRFMERDQDEMAALIREVLKHKDSWINLLRAYAESLPDDAPDVGAEDFEDMARTSKLYAKHELKALEMHMQELQEASEDIPTKLLIRLVNGARQEDSGAFTVTEDDICAAFNLLPEYIKRRMQG